MAESQAVFKIENDTEMVNAVWKYKGDVIPMIDNIQWAFVVEAMSKKDNHRLMNIISNSGKMREAAEEYGMTRLAVAKEMVRLGRKAIQILEEQAEDED